MRFNLSLAFSFVLLSGIVLSAGAARAVSSASVVTALATKEPTPTPKPTPTPRLVLYTAVYGAPLDPTKGTNYQAMCAVIIPEPNLGPWGPLPAGTTTAYSGMPGKSYVNCVAVISAMFPPTATPDGIPMIAAPGSHLSVPPNTLTPINSWAPGQPPSGPPPSLPVLQSSGL